MIRGVVVIEGSPKGMAKQFRSIVKEELQKLVENWHENVAPKHFEPAARRRYKYSPRSRRYLQTKLKKRPMAGPLEFSGESKRKLLQSIRITGSAKKASGAMDAPRYFWMRPPGHPKKGEELVAVTKEEALAKANLLNERVTKRLNALKDKEVIR